jgi:Zn-dependent peptidase ImmA (M78 family)
MAEDGVERMTTPRRASDLRRELRELGLADSAIAAVWPAWWSDDADSSSSARADLAFTVARGLGLEPASLMGGGAPRFLWRAEARFKHIANEGDLELAGITSFGRSVATVLVSATPEGPALPTTSAAELRNRILAAGRPYVDLGDLLALCWTVGIPVAYLRVFPWPRKRMAAMAAAVTTRSAILLAKDASYPPAIAFYVAHELGHLVLGHLTADRMIVDLSDPAVEITPGDDDEEQQADAFALELLTGDPRPQVTVEGARANATRLAHAATEASAERRVEPGVVAQLFGYATNDWEVATGALKVLYGDPRPVWADVNGVARRSLDLELIPDEAAHYLDAVLGANESS